jgi:paraquat-inducible protein B
MNNPTPPDLPPAQRGGGIPFSLVWLVPLLALGVALFISWQAYSSRGPLIKITFASAEGITADSTVLRFREVNVGMVESVIFTSDLQSVDVHVRVDKDVAEFIDASAEFWIVRPQVTARGITGLGTVLSGVYIEGSWDAEPGEIATEFRGLPAPPLVQRGQPGVKITLRAPEGGRLQAGAPIVYRGVTVGSIDTPRLSEDGGSVIADGFIEAPHDMLVTTGTRFWTASGFSVTLGTGGLALNVASIAALLEGGIAFETVVPDGTQAVEGAVYDVYSSENDARENTIAMNVVGEVPFSVLFDGSISGLSAGAAVEYQGLRVGSVTGLGIMREVSDSETTLRLRADIALSASRIGLPEGSDPEQTVAFIGSAVGSGLRARLVSEGLLSSKLKIELLQIPDAAPASLDMAAEPAPAIPTAPSAVSDVADSARSVLTRIQNLPLESLLDNFSSVLASIEAVVSSEDVRNAPAAIVGLIDETRTFIGSEALRSTIDGASDSVEQVRLLLERVNDSDAVPAVLAALQRTDAIAASLQDTAAGLPELLDRIQEVANEAAAMSLDQLAASATAVVEDARALIGSEAIAGIPQTLATSLANLQAATESVRDVTRDVADSGAVASVLAALDQTGTVMASIQQTTAGLPELVQRIDGLITEAASLPLSQLTSSANEVLTSANRLLGSEATARIPANVDAALTELTATLANVDTLTTRMTQGPALDNLMAAISRTDAIARSIEESSAQLPQLLEQIRAVASEAEQLPLTDLVTSANNLVQSADALVSSPETAQIPEALAFALAELGTTLDELNNGGAVANTNAALASAASAADAVAAAAQGLPELTARLDSLILTSEQTLANYGDRSEFSTQTLEAIRELRNAARAVTALARTIERQPNSLIMGR